MDTDNEVDIRREIKDINAIPIAQKNEHHFKRLNDLEAEIRRRHPEGFSFVVLCVTVCLFICLLVRLYVCLVFACFVCFVCLSCVCFVCVFACLFVCCW